MALETARVRIGNQAPRLAPSSGVKPMIFLACRRGIRRMCPGDKGMMSRNAMTCGVERIKWVVFRSSFCRLAETLVEVDRVELEEEPGERGDGYVAAISQKG